MYIRVYGAAKPPHLLPTFVPCKLVLREITYHIILNAFNASMNKDQKILCPPYPLNLGMYSLANCTHARIETKAILDISLSEGRFTRHDTK